ncbi:hypothetical protein NDU88_005650 [Pleurodeles waltl]|uniref:Uncharacterized protein n=1 Tax=Pleurodeles waltl TaxID=8319 RepID=A0AAV7WB45_PLEWA|nr:hypothetical protein NDU88_005650 [Pleurodeles waltl]
MAAAEPKDPEGRPAHSSLTSEKGRRRRKPRIFSNAATAAKGGSDACWVDSGHSALSGATGLISGLSPGDWTWQLSLCRGWRMGAQGGRSSPGNFATRQPCLETSRLANQPANYSSCRPSPVTAAPHASNPPETTQAPKTDVFMDRILQEITVVGRRLEGMDTKISVLAAQSRSIRSDIASFQDKVTNMDRRLFLMEDKLNSLPNRDQEWQCFRDKFTDLEDQSGRDNIHSFGIPEQAEGTDVKTFLITNIPLSQALHFLLCWSFKEHIN